MSKRGDFKINDQGRERELSASFGANLLRKPPNSSRQISGPLIANSSTPIDRDSRLLLSSNSLVYSAEDLIKVERVYEQNSRERDASTSNH